MDLMPLALFGQGRTDPFILSLCQFGFIPRKMPARSNSAFAHAWNCMTASAQRPQIVGCSGFWPMSVSQCQQHSHFWPLAKPGRAKDNSPRFQPWVQCPKSTESRQGRKKWWPCASTCRPCRDYDGWRDANPALKRRAIFKWWPSARTGSRAARPAAGVIFS